MTKKIEFPNANDIIERYISGISINQLSKELFVSRPTITRLLKSNNIQTRSQSESETIKWANMSEQQRKRQVQKAHQKCRGRLISTAEKMKRAKSAYLSAFKAGGHEFEIIEILKEFGVDAIGQFNFGIYNIDISIHGMPIFIEVQSSNYGLFKTPKFHKRTKYIIDSKKFLLYVVVDQSNKRILLESIAHKIISYINRFSSGEAICGKYAMIGRDGNTFPSTCYDFSSYNGTNIVNNIYTSNCRCSSHYIPIEPDYEEEGQQPLYSAPNVLSYLKNLLKGILNIKW